MLNVGGSNVVAAIERVKHLHLPSAVVLVSAGLAATFINRCIDFDACMFRLNMLNFSSAMVILQCDGTVCFSF